MSESSKLTADTYKAPSLDKIDLAVPAVICQSSGNLYGNERMSEEDLGDGGFK